MFKQFIQGLVVILCGIPLHLSAQTIDPAMIAQIQALPKAQQEALARQYGIDLNAMTRGQSSPLQLAQPGEPLTQAQPSAELQSFNYFSDLEEEDEIKRFGVDLFNQEVTTFAPTDNAQVPSDYRLGVGDELSIQLYGNDNQELTLMVNRSGELNFPKLGAFNVAGLTFDDATKLIKNRIKEQFIGVEALVSMGRLRVINVFMAGEVKVPGAYSVSALTTVTQGLFQAGGVSDIGSLRNIQVKRSGKTVAVFDVYDLLLAGDTTQDVRLQSGDVIFVPTYDAIIEVLGEVKRPMLYESAGETIQEVISMAGGFTSNAFDEQVSVIRNNRGALAKVINVDLASSKSVDITVQDGDKVTVFSNSERLTNTVKISGAVTRPGSYGWHKGNRVSDLLTDIRRDFNRTADLEYALIVREKNARNDIEVLQFSPVLAVTEPGSINDIVLQDNDEIVIVDYVSLTALDKKKTEALEKAKTQTENEQYNRMQREQARIRNLRLRNSGMVGNDDSLSDMETIELSEYQDESEESDDDVVDNSRETLLLPIVEKLKNQVRQSEPVQVVTISGAVKAPGEYPLGNDYTIGDLVLAAGGLKDSAFLQSVEIRRVNQQVDGNIEAEYFNTDISSAKQLEAFSLKSRDHVNVRESADWNPTDTIEITGEVKFPGQYLVNKGETLTSVIRRAGGVTNEGSLKSAVFTRESIAEQETERAKEFAQSVVRDFAASVLTEETIKSTFEEVSAIAVKLSEFEGQGRLLIDLNAAFAGNTNADMEVLDGDKLHIPKRTNTVTVVGEVRRQGTHGFDGQLSLEDYIALSAGLSKRADNDNIYIIKANGAVVMPDTSLTAFASPDMYLSAGDTVIVPVDGGYKDNIPLWRDITQIIYQGTVAIAAVANL